MFTLFKPSPADAAGMRLLETVTAMARQPALFGPDRAPDTIAGRFEMMALFGGLAILRLRQSPEADRVAQAQVAQAQVAQAQVAQAQVAQAQFAQAFVDRFFKGLDAGLRESGVGDLTVPKKMKAIAGAIYGRIGAYEAGLAAPHSAELRTAIVRNLFAGVDTPFADPLCDHVRAVWAAISAASLAEIETPAAWPLFIATA
jgi:cytochrome b pre-mRNA-processing protein 3